jgi:endonuclease/exonuclease/phosphatase family metal-dependent hydrolase
LAVACAGIALLPLLRGVPTSPPPTRDDAAAVVVTFNLHAGFDERGGWAFDRMIRSLKEQGPDVAALQEVSRGWVVNGSADLYELAREQLGLTGAYGPSVTTDWGNAVFVRGTIVAASMSPLPPPDLALTRSVLVGAREGDGYPRRIVATHLHHRTADDAIRELQARAITASFPASREAVLLADFRAARTASQCFSILRGAGWSDAGGARNSRAARRPSPPCGRPAHRHDLRR